MGESVYIQGPSQASSGAGTPFVPLPLRIPVELTTHICSILLEVHPPSLNACTRVCRAFFNIAAPVLYTRIRISPEISRDCRQDFSLERLAPNRNPDSFGFSSGSKGGPYQSRTKTTRKTKLLANARVISIDAHPHTWCFGKDLQHFPHLDTLVLWHIQNPQLSVLHSSHQFGGYDATASSGACPLLKYLLPRKLVFRDATIDTLMHGPSGPLSYLKSCLRLEELTVLFPSLERIGLADLKCTDIWSLYSKGQSGIDPQHNLKKITCIFHTQHAREEWKMLGIARNRLTPFNDVELLVFGNLVKNRPPNSVLTFVNARSINPSILRQTLATTTSARNRSRRSVFTLGTEILHDGVEAEDAFRRAIKERIIRKTLSDHDRRGRSAALSDEERMKMQKEKDAELDQIEEAFERVRWLDMETWLKEDGWAGVLTYKEARRWLADDWLRA